MNRIGDIKGAYRIVGIAPKPKLATEKRTSYHVVCVSCGQPYIKDSKQLYSSHIKLSSGCNKCTTGGGGIPTKKSGKTTLCYPLTGGELGLSFIAGRL